MFVSIGHRVDLESAVKLVLACCTRYRIPEPTRQADIEVAKLKRKLETSFSLYGGAENPQQAVINFTAERFKHRASAQNPVR